MSTSNIDFYKEGFNSFDPNVSRTVGDLAIIFYETQGIFDDLEDKWPNDGWNHYPNPKWADFCNGYADAATEHEMKKNPKLAEFVKYCISNNIEIQSGGYKVYIDKTPYDLSIFRNIYKYLNKKGA